MIQRARALAVALLLLSVLGGAALAQEPETDDLVQLDFNDAPLTEIIDAISRMTNRNFIYDERVRGNVTIKSPTPISKEQAYAVFESVLQVKGFTTVKTPGGALKIIPLRDAKETNIETSVSTYRPQNRDRFITRLIPLEFIEAEPIVNTLKPLVSKDANISAYAPTNTVILTEAASNIRRILAILEAIDVESYKEELAVLTIEHADAATLATQISEIYGAEVSNTASTPAASRRGRSSRRAKASTTPSPTAGVIRAKVRILTDTRTNALIVLAASEQLEDVRSLVARLDVPVSGGGRIHVYYLQHADATDLAQTLGSFISGRGAPAGGGGGGASGGGSTAQTLRAAVTSLAGGISVTADVATNSLLIQASKEGFDTISGVIAKLDVERPQVLVEALIIEVDVTDSETLGFTGLVRFINGDTEFSTLIAPATFGGMAAGGPIGGAIAAGLPLVQRFLKDTRDLDASGNPTGSGQVIETIINAAAADNGTNIISAPHILTMDNEQAEIRIGQNIPIITNRVQSAAGVTAARDQLATSVNVERQDIGVTLRVTPHITEGESLRMEIFQEISAINQGLSSTFDSDSVGVPLSQRTIENTVIVKDSETVVIGGLLSDEYQDQVSKVPFLGDIPILGWAFKTTTRSLRKINLLIFLTPHIVRSTDDMEQETIYKREEFAESSQEGLEWSDRERQVEKSRQKEALEAGEPYEPRGQNPARIRVLKHEARYPVERLDELDEKKRAERERLEAERLAAERAPYYMVAALVTEGEDEAMGSLQDVIDAGHDGTLVSTSLNGGMAFELQVGPYATIDQAQRVRSVIEKTQGLNATILVVPNPHTSSGEEP